MIRRNRDSLKRWCSVLGFVLHPGQQRVLDAFADGIRFLVVVCGRRWGKTLLAFIIAGYGLLEKDTRILVVSKTYRLASRVWSMLVPQVARVFGKQARIFRGSLTIRTLWGSELVLGSADHPDSLLGEGYDLVIFDEAATCPRDIWQQYIRPALMDKGGGALFITTPRGHNWIYDLFELGQDPDFPEYWSIQAPSSSNPYIPSEELAEARRTTDPTTWRQEYEAQFVSFASQTFDTFSYERHVIDTLPDLTGWTISVSVDPGLANACAIGWIAHNPVTKDDIVIESIELRNKTFDPILTEINAHRPPQGYELLVCDIAGKARNMETGASFIGYMKDHGLRFKAHSQGVVDGVNCVRGRLLNVDNEVHLRFFGPKCGPLLKALENYHYEEREDGTISEEPVKDGINDHSCDMLRYYTTYRHTRKPGRSWQT